MRHRHLAIRRRHARRPARAAPRVVGRGRYARRPAPFLLICLLVCGTVVVARRAGAAIPEYGIAAGPSVPLWPSDTLGGCIGLSAGAATGGSSSLLRVRGELLGVITGDTKAVMPMLGGEAGLRYGRLELYGLAGVQLFGVAARRGHVVFATLGLQGGGGLSVQLTRQLRLSVRGAMTWLPSFSAATLSAGDGERPPFAFLTVLVGLELRALGVAMHTDSDLYD
jgi:hypothetical protein